MDEGDCTWDGEKYVLTLYAHWEKKNTVFYHYNNGTGKVDEATKKLLADNITYVPLTAGETIGKKEIVPGYVDHTFLCWSKEDGAYAPWDFANDVFPEGENELHLYAYYIEGTYTRINSVKSLADVGKDPSGKYLLTEDVRLPGTGYTSSPLGLTEETLFTGEFLAFGHKITGLTFNLVPSKKYAGSSDVLSAFLFPVVSGGKIEGLSVEAEYVISGLSSRDEPLFREDIRIACSGLVGEVLPSLGGTGERTRIKDCSVALTVRPKSSSALQSSAYRYLIDVADLVWSGAEASFAVSGCSSGVDSSALTGSVSVSAKKLAG